MLTQGRKSIEGEESEQTLEVPPGPQSRRKRRSKNSGFVRLGARAMWRARTARTASLSLLLAAMFGLYVYYGSGYPQHQQIYSKQRSTPVSAPPSPEAAFDPLSHLALSGNGSTELAPWWSSSPSADLWQALNPSGTAHVRMIVEPWSILSLRSSGAKKAKPRGSFAGWALLRPRMRQIIWLLKIVVLPISATTALLWILLLYLLKDTELLEMQNDHDLSIASNLWNEDGASARLDEAFDVHMHQSDASGDLVRVIDSNQVLILLDLTGTIIIRDKARPDRRHSPWLKVSARLNAEMRTKGDSITAACIDDDIGAIFLGTQLGTLQAISLNGGSDFPTKIAEITESSSSAILHLALVRRESTSNFSPSIALAVTHADGSIWERGVGTDTAARIATAWPNRRAVVVPTSIVTATSITDSAPVTRELTTIGIASGDEFHLWGHARRNGQWTRLLTCQVGAKDRVRCAAVLARGRGLSTPTGVFEDPDQSISDPPLSHSAILGTNAGSVRIYDTQSGALLQDLDLGDGPIVKLLCSASAGAYDDGFQISALTRSRMWFVRVSPKAAPPSPSPSTSFQDLHNAKSETNGDPLKTPTRPRVYSSTANGNGGTSGSYFLTTPGGGQESSPARGAAGDQSYPMSTHGSRNRRSSGYYMRSQGSSHGVFEPEVDQTLRVLGVTDCLRGSADVVDQWVIGVRRGLRLTDATTGPLRSQPTGRWQVFALDLQNPVTSTRGQARVASTTLSLEESRLPENAEVDFFDVPSVALAVSDIRLAQASADRKSLYFGFGNVLGEVHFSEHLKH